MRSLKALKLYIYWNYKSYIHWKPRHAQGKFMKEVVVMADLRTNQSFESNLSNSWFSLNDSLMNWLIDSMIE